MDHHMEQATVNAQANRAGSAENMRPNDAAIYTRISVSTLAKLRMRHKRTEGPIFLKINGCVIYRRDDLDVWMNSHAVYASG